MIELNICESPQAMRKEYRKGLVAPAEICMMTENDDGSTCVYLKSLSAPIWVEEEMKVIHKKIKKFFA